MNRIAGLSAGERRELFVETGARRGMSPAIAEKDLWVCWVLRRLFADGALRDRMVFKGGTTLSKVYGLIDRFSEDIDLVLDWRLLGYAAELECEFASETQRDKFHKAVNARAAEYIRGPLLEQLKETLAGAGLEERYLRPAVRLEIGPLASWVPSSRREIRPYAAEVFPGVFGDAVCPVVAIAEILRGLGEMEREVNGESAGYERVGA